MLGKHPLSQVIISKSRVLLFSIFFQMPPKQQKGREVERNAREEEVRSLVETANTCTYCLQILLVIFNETFKYL